MLARALTPSLLRCRASTFLSKWSKLQLSIPLAVASPAGRSISYALQAGGVRTSPLPLRGLPALAQRAWLSSGPASTGTSGKELESILSDAASSPGGAGRFYRALLETTVLVPQVPGPNTPIDHPTDDGEGTVFHFPMITHEGKSYIPFFTTEERLKEISGPEGIRYIGIVFRDLLTGMPPGDEPPAMVLNPGSSTGKFFTPSEVAAIRNGSIFNPDEILTVPKGTKYLIGELEIYPTELTDALSQCLAALPQVRAAYVAGVMQEEEGSPNTLIALDVEESEMETVMRDVIVTINNVKNIPNRPVDCAPVSAFDWFNDKKPFYKA